MMLYTKYESSGPCSFRQNILKFVKSAIGIKIQDRRIETSLLYYVTSYNCIHVHLTVSFWQVKVQQAMNMKLIKYTGFQEIPGTRLSSTTHCLNVFTHQISIVHIHVHTGNVIKAY